MSQIGLVAVGSRCELHNEQEFLKPSVDRNSFKLACSGRETKMSRQFQHKRFAEELIWIFLTEAEALALSVVEVSLECSSHPQNGYKSNSQSISLIVNSTCSQVWVVPPQCLSDPRFTSTSTFPFPNSSKDSNFFIWITMKDYRNIRSRTRRKTVGRGKWINWFRWITKSLFGRFLSQANRRKFVRGIKTRQNQNKRKKSLRADNLWMKLYIFMTLNLREWSNDDKLAAHPRIILTCAESFIFPKMLKQVLGSLFSTQNQQNTSENRLNHVKDETFPWKES
jgi:hypothetical protein